MQIEKLIDAGSFNRTKYHALHPFPARMAPEIAFSILDTLSSAPAIVLDPMAGSGTSLLAAKMRGHHAIGFDLDPLAILISRALLENYSYSEINYATNRVLERSRQIYGTGSRCPQYPLHADAETREFIRYWFPRSNRYQLAALSIAIREGKNKKLRNILWCAFSRLIIAKNIGASLAKDLPHSRPHRDTSRYCLMPIKSIEKSIREVTQRVPFIDRAPHRTDTEIEIGDARKLPIPDASVDIVITSPPYLNAIDYIRCHKFSLIWMGWNLHELRNLRSELIGAERSLVYPLKIREVPRSYSDIGRLNKLRSRDLNIVLRYLFDMKQVVLEISRVLRKNGMAAIVISKSYLSGVRLHNDNMIRILAESAKLAFIKAHRREILPKKRYLPPPMNYNVGPRLSLRMNVESVLYFKKR